MSDYDIPYWGVRTWIRGMINYLKIMHRRRVVGYGEALKRILWTLCDKRKKYNLYTIREKKTSDTIFLLGSGPSLNELTKGEMKTINTHDSFGMAYSILKEGITPTFYQPSYETTEDVSYFEKIFDEYRYSYRDTVFFIHLKHLFRFCHPRISPLIFPENPEYCLYRQSDSIYLRGGETFTDKDFDRTLIYRNIMSLVIDLSVQMGYKKIVLVGVDLDKWEFFYKDYPEMEQYMKRYDTERPEMKAGMKFDTMYPRECKAQPFDNYLYSVANYLKRKRGIDLYIGKKDNMLYPKLKAYF